MKNPRVLFWTVFLVTLIVDQASKAWARSAFTEHQSPGFPWPGVFELTLTYNKGIAFGMLQGAGVFLAPIAIAIAVAAWMYSHRNNGEGSMSHISMALLASGALGNLYDRVMLGKVTDIFWFRAINFPVFNVADSCITIAAGLLILKWSKEFVAEKKGGEDVDQESPPDLPEAKPISTVGPETQPDPQETKPIETATGPAP